MKEFKIKYSHSKAQKILDGFGARLIRQEVLEDFYLIDKTDIWKLSFDGKAISLVRLVNEGDDFGVAFDARLDEAASRELEGFFKKNKKVIRKDRRHYNWQESKIVLDNIKGLGEFVELYPASDQDRQDLFAAFNIQPQELIKVSYAALRKNNPA